MAIIYSYPEKTSPVGGDFLVITDSEQAAPNKNRTKSLTIDNLASYITTSTSGITGSGTLSTIAMFTPDSQKIGDSFIKQQVIAATNLVRIDGGGGFLNKFQSDEIQTSSLLTDNITAEGTGNVILKGGVIIGDQSTDILQITSKVSDSTGTGSTAAGEVLVSNASGQLVWDTLSAGGVTGSGTVNQIPMFTPDGTTLGDSIMKQAGNPGNPRIQVGNISNGTSFTSSAINTQQLSSEYLTVINASQNAIAIVDTLTVLAAAKILGVPVHADNAAALAAGLVVGELYRTGDLLKIVH